MKKRVFAAAAVLAMAVIGSSVYAAEYTAAGIVVNNKSIEAEGIIKDSRTLVPVRGVFEALGYSVEWNAETKTAHFDSSTYSIDIQSGAESFACTDKVKGTTENIVPDVPQQIIEGHFYIPLRAVSESVGAGVSWDAETKTAVITTGEKRAEPVELLQKQAPQPGDLMGLIHTNMGDISVRFFPRYAPKAVENFATHAKEGYYDGITFHRVINNFVIQGGDPTGTGRGGESIWGSDFENEVTWNLRNFRGALCMANSGPDTNGSQFYIVQCPEVDEDIKSQLEQIREMPDELFYVDDHGEDITYGAAFPDEVIDEYIQNGGYPSLDMAYTVFGQVCAGMEVVDAVAAVETDASDKPLEDVVISSVEIYEYEG